MMSELQSNQTTNVPNFSTPTNVIKGSGEAPSKSKLEAIYNKDEKVNIEEDILDNTSVSESLTEYTEDSDDPEDYFNVYNRDYAIELNEILMTKDILMMLRLPYISQNINSRR